MWNLLLAGFLLIMSIIVHELVHYFMAKHYGYDAWIGLIPSKEKKTIGFFGWLPACYMKIDEDRVTKKQLFYILISPLFFGMITNTLVLLIAVWRPDKFVFWFGGCFLFGQLASFAASKSDIKDFKYYSKIFHK